MKDPKSIRALFAFPGFAASSKLVGVFGDRYARVIRLKRQKKQRSVLTAATGAGGITTRSSYGCEISQLPDGESTWSSNVGASVVRSAAACT